MIRVYADWQPGYMGERIPVKQEDFKTIEEATPTIKKWKETACTVRVMKVEEEIIAKYVWGKIKKEKKKK
jgi:hypothetical protein